MMWSEHTFQVLSLYGVEIEPPVSPTIFASAADAWTTLPAELRAEVERRSAVQGHNENERARAEHDPDVLITTFDNLPTRTTPIKYPHPRTGAPILYVSQQMTCAIEGLPPADSEALLEELFGHLYRRRVHLRARLAPPRPRRVGQHRGAARAAERHGRRSGADAAQGVRAAPAALPRSPHAPEVRNRRLNRATSSRSSSAGSPRRGAVARSAGRESARPRRGCRCPRAHGRTPRAHGSRAPGRGRRGG